MRTRTLSLTSLFVLLASLSAFAQRPTPAADDPRPFVEVADLGSMCPACQVLILSDVDVYQSQPGTPTFDPYKGEWSLGFRTTPSTGDVLIYDGSTGHTLFVETQRFGTGVSPFPATSILESAQWIMLREGMFWDKGDLDGDGRDDLIGHDKRTGEIVRVFRRGR
jgi:hypothetical protein